MRGFTKVFMGFAFLTCLPSAALSADRPGQVHRIGASDLPKPFATPAVANSSQRIARPAGAQLQVPKGFAVSVFALGLKDARFLAAAPNGDVFVSQPDEGRISIIHDGKASTFASGGFNRPHGLAVHNGALYVGDLIAVWKLGYKDGALHESGVRTRLTKDGFGPLGGHFTRDIAFDRDGALYVAIGSMGNLDEEKPPRGTVQKVDAEGHLSTFVSGTRNPVGIVLRPGTNDLYVTVNERDGYGDALVPDYFTRAQQGDFFGWPYAYTGSHPDPTFGTKRPDLVAKTKVPDVLFQAHSAPLGIAFYDGRQFPADYAGDAFVALHGSWNSGRPTGYKVVRVKFAKGRPTGEYQDFVTGFWDGTSSPAKVWGRPAGLAIAKDGSLLIGDDVGNVVWRVAYTGK